MFPNRLWQSFAILKLECCAMCFRTSFSQIQICCRLWIVLMSICSLFRFEFYSENQLSVIKANVPDAISCFVHRSIWLQSTRPSRKSGSPTAKTFSNCCRKPPDPVPSRQSIADFLPFSRRNEPLQRQRPGMFSGWYFQTGQITLWSLWCNGDIFWDRFLHCRRWHWSALSALQLRWRAYSLATRWIWERKREKNGKWVVWWESELFRTFPSYFRF